MWSTSSSYDAPGLSAAAVWSRAYADASAWPAWNDALAVASLGEAAGVRLVNTIYIRGPLARLWAPILGPQAKKGLPGWQRRAAALAADTS